MYVGKFVCGYMCVYVCVGCVCVCVCVCVCACKWTEEDAREGEGERYERRRGMKGVNNPIYLNHFCQ